MSTEDAVQKCYSLTLNHSTGKHQVICHGYLVLNKCSNECSTIQCIKWFSFLLIDPVSVFFENYRKQLKIVACRIENKKLSTYLYLSYTGRVNRSVLFTKHCKYSHRSGCCTYLFKSQGALAQANADLSLVASDARVAFLNILQAKSHSSTPPKAMAMQ